MERKPLLKNLMSHIKQSARLLVDRTGDEWHTFCDWIEDLPYSELITGEKKGDKYD